MIRGKLFSEIFDEFKKASSKQDKINVLRYYDTPRLRAFFQILYKNHIVFDVEIPNYRPAVEPAGLNWTYLCMELDKLYRFTSNSPLPMKKKVALLALLLESLHKDEAEILVHLIKKDLNIEFLNPNIVKEALPEIDI